MAWLTRIHPLQKKYIQFTMLNLIVRYINYKCFCYDIDKWMWRDRSIKYLICILKLLYILLMISKNNHKLKELVKTFFFFKIFRALCCLMSVQWFCCLLLLIHVIEYDLKCYLYMEWEVTFRLQGDIVFSHKKSWMEKCKTKY